MVYLVEELGDARMRCDQLLRYVEKAVALVEKSSHKDHFFEVAGDVIRGLPETAFKLHKALEAVALAANRIDYEEIKQDLRPEKVEELERVLKDVRIRQVQRRSLPMVNPASVVEQLKGLAKKANEEGHLDTEGLTTLIASLEVGSPRVAESPGAKVAAQLDAMVHALQNPPKGELPSRYRLARILRTMLAEQLDLRTAAKPPEAAADEISAAVAALKKLALGSGNPKLLLMSALSNIGLAVKNLGQDEAITNLLERTVAVVKSKWSAKDLKDVGKGEESKTAADDALEPNDERGPAWEPTTAAGILADLGLHSKALAKRVESGRMQGVGRGLFGVIEALAGAAYLLEMPKLYEHLMRARTMSVIPTHRYAADEDKRSRFEEGKPADPTKGMDPEDAKAWKENTDKYEDKFKKEAVRVSDAAVLEIDTAILGLKQMRRGAGNPKRNLFSIVGSLSKAAAHLGQDDRISHALDRAGLVINQTFSLADMREYSDAKELTAADEDKRSRFEEGKPADPTKDMDPEDAKAWKENTDKYEDKFKAASERRAGGQSIPAPPGNVVEEIMAWHGGQGSKLYSVGSRWYGGHKVDADDAEAAFDELEGLHANHDALSDFEDHLVEHGVTPTSVRERHEKVDKRWLKEMETMLRGAGFNPKDAKKLQEEGMGPEDLRVRLKVAPGATGSLEYTHNLKRKSKGKKADGDAEFWKAAE